MLISFSAVLRPAAVHSSPADTPHTAVALPLQTPGILQPLLQDIRGENNPKIVNPGVAGSSTARYNIGGQSVIHF